MFVYVWRASTFHVKMYIRCDSTPHSKTHKCQAHVHTVYVFDHIDAEAMSGNSGEHLPRTPPPRQVVGGAPRGDGTEQQLQVIFLGQLLSRRHECAEFNQNLWKDKTRTVLLQTELYPVEAETETVAKRYHFIPGQRLFAGVPSGQQEQALAGSDPD